MLTGPRKDSKSFRKYRQLALFPISSSSTRAIALDRPIILLDDIEV
jgi:hypothetical protein